MIFSRRNELWILTFVTYGLVAALTLGAAIYYFYLHSAAGPAEPDRGTLVPVGSVWVPAYPGAVVTNRASSANADAIQTTVHLKSADPFDKVFSFYEDKLKSTRYFPDRITRTPEGGTILADRRDGKARILVTLSAAGEGSTGVITALEKKPATDR